MVAQTYNSSSWRLRQENLCAFKAWGPGYIEILSQPNQTKKPKQGVEGGEQMAQNTQVFIFQNLTKTVSMFVLFYSVFTIDGRQALWH